MPLGENRNTNHRGVYNLEFVVHIVAFGLPPPQHLSFPPVLHTHIIRHWCSRPNGSCSAKGFNPYPTLQPVPVTVFCRSFLKYLGTWPRYRVLLGFDSRQELRFLFSYPSRLSLGLADPPVLWEYRSLSGVKRPEHGAAHLLLVRVEKRNVCTCALSSPTRLHCVGLVRSCVSLALPLCIGRGVVLSHTELCL